MPPLARPSRARFPPPGPGVLTPPPTRVRCNHGDHGRYDVLSRLHEIGMDIDTPTRPSLVTSGETNPSHHFISEYADELWVWMDDNSDWCCVPRVEHDQSLWFLCLRCDLEIQVIDDTKPNMGDQQAKVDPRGPHVLTAAMNVLHSLSRATDFSICRIFEGHDNQMFICFKSPDPLPWDRFPVR